MQILKEPKVLSTGFIIKVAFVGFQEILQKSSISWTLNPNSSVYKHD